MTMSPIRVEQDAITVYVREETDGRLVCSCTTFAKIKPGCAASCVHLQGVMVNELDARTADGTLQVIHPKAVVLIFEQPKLEAKMHLVKEGDSLWKVSLPTYKPGKYIHIGFIGDGQGRMSIRRLLLEWLYAAQFERPDCEAPHHTVYLSELSNPANVETKRMLMIDTFDILVTGRCRTCNDNSGVPSLD